MQEDLSPAGVVLAVKEIPIALLQGPRAFVYFSHVIKGQDYNMPMLQHLLDEGATLIDYEKIADAQNRRLIFFSIHAGYAGMIESLVALAQRLELQGCPRPWPRSSTPTNTTIWRRPRSICAGSGRASARRGSPPWIVRWCSGSPATAMCTRVAAPSWTACPSWKSTSRDLERTAAAGVDEVGPLVAVKFKEEDMVEPRSPEAQFVLQDYYQHPENYRGVVESYLPHLGRPDETPSSGTPSTRAW